VKLPVNLIRCSQIGTRELSLMKPTSIMPMPKIKKVTSRTASPSLVPPLLSILFLAVITSTVVVGQQQSEQGTTTTTTICSPASNTFTAKINFTEGHLGYFSFTECGDDVVNPTIGLKIGETYTFRQGDISNWYHPLGFAYGPDGAHDEQDELEKCITRTNSSCATGGLTCPAPQYQLNGEFLGDVTVPEDFGLDEYEPRFFLPLLDWIDQGTFTIDLTFDDATIGQDAFYFCHVRVVVHACMQCMNAMQGATDGDHRYYSSVPLCLVLRRDVERMHQSIVAVFSHTRSLFCLFNQWAAVIRFTNSCRAGSSFWTPTAGSWWPITTTTHPRCVTTTTTHPVHSIASVARSGWTHIGSLTRPVPKRTCVA
jgi:hypothetical protein